jgi:hypothetical protein
VRVENNNCYCNGKWDDVQKHCIKSEVIMNNLTVGFATKQLPTNKIAVPQAATKKIVLKEIKVNKIPKPISKDANNTTNQITSTSKISSSTSSSTAKVSLKRGHQPSCGYAISVSVYSE